MLTLTSPPEVALNLARRIREQRLNRGWSQLDLAERSGLKLSTYILFERTGHISLLRLLRILDILGQLGEVEKIAAAEIAPQSLDQLIKPKRQRGRKKTKT